MAAPPIPPRMVVFIVVVALVGGFSLLRGLGILGEPDGVHLFLGSLGVLSLALFAVGYVRERRRR